MKTPLPLLVLCLAPGLFAQHFDPRPDGAGRIGSGSICESVLWRANSEISVIGQFHGPLPGALTQAALCDRLHPPGDPFEKKILVVGPALLAEQLQVFRPELAYRHPAQAFDFRLQCATQSFLLLGLR